jgi:hypothetical protein
VEHAWLIPDWPGRGIRIRVAGAWNCAGELRTTFFDLRRCFLEELMHPDLPPRHYVIAAALRLAEEHDAIVHPPHPKQSWAEYIERSYREYRESRGDPLPPRRIRVS